MNPTPELSRTYRDFFYLVFWSFAYFFGLVDRTAILATTSGANTQVWYDSNTATLGSESSIATLNNQSIYNISQANFVVV